MLGVRANERLVKFRRLVDKMIQTEDQEHE